MTDLDKKLKEILLPAIHALDSDESDTLVTQIKQAFADEGYEKVEYERTDQREPVVERFGSLGELGSPKMTIHEWNKILSNKEIMTGQEWYNRFEKELETWKQYGDKVNYMWNTDTVLKAAKKASGLDK